MEYMYSMQDVLHVPDEKQVDLVQQLQLPLR